MFHDDAVKHAVEAATKALRAERDEALAVLRKVQWQFGIEGVECYRCVDCGAEKGHPCYPACRLSALLAKEERRAT